MPTMITGLAQGSLGARLRLPSDARIAADEPGYARWLEPDLQIVGQASIGPIATDLQPMRDPTLRAQFELDARRMFERESLARTNRATQSPLRTRDPAWSPIIELELLERGARVLRCMHRLGYEPGFECIRATILCPTSAGTLRLVGLHVAQQTGLRESTLALLSGGKHPGQAAFDAPEHDASFPTHGLTLVRAWQRRVLDAGAGLTITRPASLPPAGRVVLPSAESSLELPPLGFVPAGRAERDAPVLFLAQGLDELSPWLFDVWKVPETLGRDAQRELDRLALRTARDWEHEGARDVSVELRPRPLARFGVQTRTLVEFETQGLRRFCVAHWFVDAGAVFRVSCSGTPPDAIIDHERLLDALLASWRREPA